MTGPVTHPMPNTPKIIDIAMARFSIPTQSATITVAPVSKPAAPQPVTSLPIMKAIELGANAQITEPDSNTSSNTT